MRRAAVADDAARRLGRPVGQRRRQSRGEAVGCAYRSKTAAPGRGKEADGFTGVDQPSAGSFSSESPPPAGGRSHSLLRPVAQSRFLEQLLPAHATRITQVTNTQRKEFRQHR